MRTYIYVCAHAYIHTYMHNPFPLLLNPPNTKN